MKCEHKGCEEESEINICHNHINEDYPPDFENEHRRVIKLIDEFEEMIKIFIKECNKDIREEVLAERSRGEQLAYKTILNSNKFKELKELKSKMLEKPKCERL